MLPAALVIQEQVKIALAEDVGSGDQTAALIPVTSLTTAQVISRQTAVLSGISWFNEVFQQLNPGIDIHWNVQDGDAIKSDQVLCLLRGNARSLLTGVCRCSGGNGCAYSGYTQDLARSATTAEICSNLWRLLQPSDWVVRCHFD